MLNTQPAVLFEQTFVGAKARIFPQFFMYVEDDDNDDDDDDDNNNNNNNNKYISINKVFHNAAF